MALLRLATDETTNIPLDEDGSFITVKADISKRVFRQIVAAMPKTVEGQDITPEEGMEFQQNLFTIFVVGWSLPVEPTVDNYLDLSEDAGRAVDEAVAKHFESLTVAKEEATKSA